MKKKYDRVFQFKVTLKGSKPPIWRRIQVPETYSFWDLHVAIQDAMGWCDCHLHQFEFGNRNDRGNSVIGIPSEEDTVKVFFDRDEPIVKWFKAERSKADYWYDFGDDWHHEVKFEKILQCERSVSYPQCIAGKRACPPEDCGGIYGYEELLRVINDPSDEQYEEMLEWVGGEHDPELFDVNEVEFDDPDERWRIAYGWR